MTVPEDAAASLGQFDSSNHATSMNSRQGYSPNSIPPGTDIKTVKIEEYLRGVWRNTPYNIVSIKYADENTTSGENWVAYEANLFVTLKFPEGWVADCVGLNAAWGCQHLDANMMHLRPFEAGKEFTYSGKINMTKNSYSGEDWGAMLRFQQQ